MLAATEAGRVPASRSVRGAFASWWPVVLGAVLPIVVFLLEGHIGFGKADEGFLWYGAQRVAAGEVPLRDFQSYDIGRYYWSALWMLLTDDRGLVVLRWSNALLAAIAVALATSLIGRAWPGRPAWIAFGATTIAVWMVPEYKAADSLAAILLIFGLTRWIEDAGPRGAGRFAFCLGIAATIGINHALYGTVGGALAYAWLRWTGRALPPASALGRLILATALGYLPVLLCLIVVPGFATAFVDSIRLLFEAGATNVDLPFPRLLAIADPGPVPWSGRARESLTAWLFFAAPVFVVAAIVRLRSRPRAPPGCVAATLLAVPYAHYAYSCPETMHLAVSGLPLLIALWTLPPRTTDAGASARRRPTFAATASLPLSLFLLAHAYAGYPSLRGRSLETVRVMTDELRVLPDAASELRLIRTLTDTFPGRAFFAAHDWPGAYASVGGRAPNWEIFELFVSRPDRQRREIARIVAADPAFVILTAGRPGDRTDGLEKTHPLIRDYIHHCFAPWPLAAPYATLPVEIFTTGPRPCATN